MWDWDEKKRRRTIEDRGIDFADVVRFDLLTAVIDPDLRRDYGEVRLLAPGMIDGRLHALCFTPRMGARRVISLRRANAREYRKWLASQS
jgi:uncharacterized DUF497 family protein